jgi:hypothetical protein
MKKRIYIVIIIIEEKTKTKLRKWVRTGISFIWEGIRKI